MSKHLQRTLVFIKPDGIQRGLVGEIIHRFERKGLKLVGLKMMRVDEALARKHYSAHEGRFYYPRLVRYVTSGPIVAMVWEGHDAVRCARALIGPTDPLEAAPGTVRGDYGTGVSMNLVHSSDSEETASREIELFFRSEEIHEYEQCCFEWLGKPDQN